MLYPVLIESDEGSIDDQKEWEREFINEYLPVSVHDCQPYFSGSRSVHAHVPLFTTGEGIEYLREVARESHAGLDEAIYSEKRQFRLPGVKHHTTRTPKTAIQWEWEREDIAREVAENGVERPETVADLLRETFGPDVLENPEQFVWEPDTGTEEVKSEPHLWEPGQPKPEGGATEKWQAYNRHAFSPHAKAEGGTRSMALIEVKNEGYCHDGRTFITAYIWMAVTCTGETWQQDASNGLSPVVLSKADYRKFREMEVKPRDELLIIGGRSHRSRILRVDQDQRGEIWDALLDEIDPHHPADRSNTLDTIESLGLDPGRPGMNGTPRADRESGESEESSRAMTLQIQAEEWGIDSLTHQERLHLGNRLLRMRGWEGAIEWYREQFGDEFDRDLTVKHLKSIADRFDDLPDV